MLKNGELKTGRDAEDRKPDFGSYESSRYSSENIGAAARQSHRRRGAQNQAQHPGPARQSKGNWNGKGRNAGDREPPPAGDALLALGEQCSLYERRADEATRQVECSLKCLYLKPSVGEQIQGRISAVARFGLFVTLDEVLVDGLVHISRLGREFFQFDEASQRLIGQRIRSIYQIGDRLELRLMGVTPEEGKVALDLVRRLS